MIKAPKFNVTAAKNGFVQLSKQPISSKAVNTINNKVALYKLHQISDSYSSMNKTSFFNKIMNFINKI